MRDLSQSVTFVRNQDKKGKIKYDQDDEDDGFYVDDDDMDDDD